MMLLGGSRYTCHFSRGPVLVVDKVMMLLGESRYTCHFSRAPLFAVDVCRDGSVIAGHERPLFTRLPVTGG